MDNRAEVRDFLTSRRARVSPHQAGLPDAGSRRVPGLRRGEVAMLAGVSIEYYAKLERGAIAGASASVLDALARALQLDDAERGHLFHLAQAADGTLAGMRPRRRGRAARGRHRRAWSGCSTASPRRRSCATVGWTCWPPTTSAAAMHEAVHASPTTLPGSPPNFARFTFLDLDAAREFYPDWDTAADTCVAILHTEAGRDPHDKVLHDLVGELSTRSPEFRRRWSAHDVRQHGSGTKRFHHRVVGDLVLAYESVDMVSEAGLTLTLYAAEPGSPTAHALDLLASWAGTQAETEAAPV